MMKKIISKHLWLGKWLVMLVFFGLEGCVSSPPKHLENVCDIFKEKRSWYKKARKAKDKWGAPIGVMMAVMHQESRFVSKAKPPRKKILGFIPGRRLSSAYGYSQAKKETWEWFQRETGNRRAKRDDFGDAIAFIAWYNAESQRRAKINLHDTYRLYLAYHEGHGGFLRGSFNRKSWLKGVARKVQKRGATYQDQLKHCERQLKRRRWF